MRQLIASNPIVEENGTMQQEFRTYMLDVAKYLPIFGTGSPEGVVEAPQFSLYINKSGTAGAIEYRKMATDIGGDKSQGWILV